MFKRLIAWLLKASITLCLLLIVLFYFLITPGQLKQETISSADVNNAHQVLRNTLSELRQPGSQISLKYNQQHLDALMNVATYAAKPVKFYAGINNYSVVVHAGVDLSSYYKGRIIYGNCMFLQGKQGFAIDSCRLGRVPIPAWLANSILQLAIKSVLASPADKQLINLFAKGVLRSGELQFVDNHAEAIKIHFNDDLHQLYDFSKTLFDAERPLATELSYYLEFIKRLARENPKEDRLAFYLQKVLIHAESRAVENYLRNELDSAFWAVISSFGNAKFASIANPQVLHSDVAKLPKVRLFQRFDLSLHFLYSAAFKQMGNRRISEQIGSLKEISDARDGGSGFSFVDLAADYAGIKFAENLLVLNMALVKAMTVTEFEAAFMPQVTDLPEGVSEQQMVDLYGGFSGLAYKSIEAEITSRLQSLPIYQQD